MILSADFEILPAGAERLRLARERGLEGDDPDLPLRVHFDRKLFTTIWIGPIAEGSADERLWILEVGG